MKRIIVCLLISISFAGCVFNNDNKNEMNKESLKQIDNSIKYFEQMSNNEMERFVVEKIKNEVILEFWKTRNEQLDLDYYANVISNFKACENPDFYIYCMNIIKSKPNADGYIIELIQGFFEEVYDTDYKWLFKYLDFLQSTKKSEGVDAILNYIGYSFQSIVKDNPTYFDSLIKKDPQNAKYFAKISKFAEENN